MRIERTAENLRLVEAITGKPEMSGRRARRLILDDGVLHRPNGRYIVGNVLTIVETGSIATRVDVDDEGQVTGRSLITKRHRFRIPKGHPWRGRRAW